jgi:tetratricopeptide (TPR) repeat protein
MNGELERVVARESRRVGKRYDRVGVLGRGATGTVYRANDRLHRRLVALKSALMDVEPPGDDPLTSQPVRRSDSLAREFLLLSSLRHPNIVTCMEYGKGASDDPYFTMDLQNDARPVHRHLDLPHDAKVDMLVQVLHALAYVHRRGLVHRDVKPDNVLATASSFGRVVKLIDFGLAAPAGHKDDSPAGTPAYAAPEVVRGAAASAAADLFAVGVIAYEMFAGKHPFDTKTTAAYLRSLFGAPPDFSAIDPRIAPVVKKLLARDPAERFGSALDVARALASPLETVSTREAFLQGTELVGRDAELERLRAAVPAQDGTGAAVIVTGESGVGKSRLLEEASAHAMVRGARVLRGQSLHTGARPYEPWRAVLRTLLLVAEPTPLEASVALAVVPDAQVILERAVAPAPELEPDATHLRLARVLEALLKRCREPLVVVLEDLQWAGAESLALAARVATLTKSAPISIIGSVRSEERLAEELAGFQTIALEPLAPDAVARLCATTIGASRLSDLVWSQSRGNAFAALEAVRALASEAGGLERVGALGDPERAIGNLTERRVERLTTGDRELLRTAAIAGRELSRELLLAIHPDADVDATAERAASAAVIASVQGRHWFAHDKLRDAVLDAMPDAERRRAHQRVAEALARIAPDDAATIAHHFRASGDHAREGEWAAKAGDLFLRSGAYRDAIPHLRRAIELSPSFAEEPLTTKPRLQRQLGESLFRWGKLDEAKASFESALAALGRPLPKSKGELGRAMLVESRAQLALRLGRARSGDEPFEEAILAYTQLSRLAHHMNDEPLVLYVTLSALNLAERGSLTVHHARLAAVFGAVMGLVPVHKWARFYFRTAYELATNRQDPSLRAFILAHEGYYEAGTAAWSECGAHLEESIDLYERIGDVRLAEESISILAYARFFQGDLDESLSLYERLQRSGEERGDAQIAGWGLANRIKVLARMGRTNEIDPAMIERAERLLVDAITKSVWDGVRIDLALADDDLDGARRAADAAAERLKASPPRSFMACSTYASIVRAYEAAGDDRASRRARRALASITRVFPIVNERG